MTPSKLNAPPPRSSTSSDNHANSQGSKNPLSPRTGPGALWAAVGVRGVGEWAVQVGLRPPATSNLSSTPVVGFPPRPGPRPGTRSGRIALAKDATTAIARRVNPRFKAPAWTGLLWGLALLGLLLLPSDYRAGAETAHGHALMQLWIDAADGAVHHHHVSAAHVAPRGVAWDWLDPSVAGAAETEYPQTGKAQSDVAGHQDSTPAVGGVHLLVTAVAFLVLGAARPFPPSAPYRASASRAVQVLLPPPRWTPLAG
jgi:hypothetical protein